MQHARALAMAMAAAAGMSLADFKALPTGKALPQHRPAGWRQKRRRKLARQKGH